MELKIIGYVRTDFPEKFGIPRQSGLVEGLKGRIVFLPEFRNPDYIRGIEGYSHLWILWGFSESDRDVCSATVAPPRLGGRTRMGVFSTRSPFRPNPIALSSVELLSVEFDKKNGMMLNISGIDMMDNSPVYDIKPYLPNTDSHPDAKDGFAGEVKEHKLEVIISQDLLKKIRPEEHENIIMILQQDPRTAFIHDEDRIWGVSYAEYNIKFIVKEKILTVTDVETR